MTRLLLAGMLLGLAIQQSCFGQESAADGEQALRERWVERVRSNLAALGGETHSSAAPIVATSLAEAGEVELAEMMIEKSLPRAAISGNRVFIAAGLSARDDVDGALEFAESFPGSLRELAYSLVILRQVQRGDLQDARELLPKIDRQIPRDGALNELSKAEALNGQIQRAIKTARKISDEDRRQRAVQDIEEIQGKNLRFISKVQSPIVRENLRTMLFVGTEGHGEAIQAILTAQETNQGKLDKQIQVALENLRSKNQIRRAITRILLAVALVEAERDMEAKEMILEARLQIGNEWSGLSTTSGSPILVHLLVRLEMDEELGSLMSSLDASEPGIDRIAYHTNLQTMGMTFVELGRIEDGETYYKRLVSPLDRVYFGAGALRGLSPVGND